MAKQTPPIRKLCQHRSVCSNDATIGAYVWVPGKTDVNLDKPARVYCGGHKPAWDGSQNVRNVKLVR